RLDYRKANAVVSSQDVQKAPLAAGAKSRCKNRRDLWLDHLPRRRVASALCRFHGEAYAFCPADSASFWIFAFDRHAGFRICMLYVLSGGLNAEGFVFATLIDRPFVAPTMATLWYFGALPGPLALLLAIED